jgi:hypothetical protein
VVCVCCVCVCVSVSVCVLCVCVCVCLVDKSLHGALIGIKVFMLTYADVC